MIINSELSEVINSPVRNVKATVDIYGSSNMNKSGNPIVAGEIKDSGVDLEVSLSSETVTDFSGVNVNVHGRNILPEFISMPELGDVFSLNNNVLLMDGSNTANQSLRKRYDFTLNPGTYTFSLQYLSGTCIDSPESIWLGLRNSATDKWVVAPGINTRNYLYGVTKTFTLTETTELYFHIVGHGSYDNLTYNLQLELGNIATEYEPYKAPQTVTAEANGTVLGLKTITPTMIISADNPEVTIKASYEVQQLLTKCDSKDKLISLDVERAGEGKFFGFGICQKANIKLIDINREMQIGTDNFFRLYFNNVSTLPLFYETETHRDENTNELSITAYDAIYKANSHNVNELGLIAPYDILGFAGAIAAFLGVGLSVAAGAAESFSLSFPTGANFEGTETLREALNDIAEATQTIYYINSANTLVFKRLDINGDAVLNIDKSKYITLKSSDNRRLASVCHATELGDNVTASLEVTGTTQYIRDNPFWDLREDTPQLVQNALAAIGGLTINQFDCEWRGNPLLEIGDKIALTTKDNGLVSSFLLDDSIFYDGSLSQHTQWRFEDSDETESNPANLGDALKQTFARVDKVNKQIDLVVSKTEENKELLTNLQLTTDTITASVESINTNVKESLDSLNKELVEVSGKVEQTITAEDLTIEVQNQLSNGVTSVTTSTGFVFNEEGLTISKTGTEMETKVTEDGMTVYRNEEAVLTANNVGVNATNLHATTYLIIGLNSRFEDYGYDRTGCFWIGGNS